MITYRRPGASAEPEAPGRVNVAMPDALRVTGPEVPLVGPIGAVPVPPPVPQSCVPLDTRDVDVICQLKLTVPVGIQPVGIAILTGLCG